MEQTLLHDDVQAISGQRAPLADRKAWQELHRQAGRDGAYGPTGIIDIPE